MPHASFNHFFNGVAQNTQANSHSLIEHYYFFEEAQADVAKQLSDFKKSEIFVNFELEFNNTLDFLKKWCIAHNIEKSLLDAELKEHSAFDLLKTRLFSGYYDKREAIFFHSGKKKLEKIVTLLNLKNISIDKKKNILLNLQKSLSVCSEGLMTNIIDAVNGLEAEVNLYVRAITMKETLIEQFALHYMRNLGLSKHNEIHYVNFLFNHVASEYHVIPRDDQFSENLQAPRFFLEGFPSFLKKVLNPNSVINYVLLSCTEAISDFLTHIKSSFFHDLDKLELTVQKKTALEEEINQWNSVQFVKIDFYFCFTLSEDGLYLYLNTINHAWITAIVTKTVREYWLTDVNPPFLTAISKNKCLYFDNDYFWVVDGDQYFSCTVSLLQSIQFSEENRFFYFTMLNKLELKSDINVLEILSIIPLDTFIKHQLDALFLIALENNLSAVKQLCDMSPEGIQLSGKLIAFLIIEKKFSIINKILEKDLLTEAHLHSAWKNILQSHHDFYAEVLNLTNLDLISKLIKKKLITHRLLELKFNFNPFSGYNFLWMLLEIKKFNLIGLFLDKKIISREMLTQPLKAPENFLLILAKTSEYCLIEKLALQEFISAKNWSELLALPENIYFFWFLTFHQCFYAANQIIENNLLTANMLAGIAHSQKDYNGLSALTHLINHRYFNLVEKLISKNLVEENMLLSSAAVGVFFEINTFQHLMQGRCFKIIESLLDKNIISEKTINHPFSFNGQKDLISILTNEKQFVLLEKFIDRNLIKTDCFSVKNPHFFTEILCVNKQFLLVYKFLEKSLIAQDLFSLLKTKHKELGQNKERLFQFQFRISDKNTQSASTLTPKMTQ